MQRRGPLIRGLLQIMLSVALLVGALIGSQVLLLLAAMAVIAMLVWEAEIRRRKRI